MNHYTKKTQFHIFILIIILISLQSEVLINLFNSQLLHSENNLIDALSFFLFHGFYNTPDIKTLFNFLIPITFFILLYGNSFFEDIHGNGIYFIIRYNSFKNWYYKKLIDLIWHAFVFFTVYICILYIFSMIITKSNINFYSFTVLCNYLSYYIILSLFISLLGNLLSFMIGRILGFIISYSCLILMHYLVLSFGRIYLFENKINIKMLIPINISLNQFNSFTIDTYISLLITIFYCIIILLIMYWLLSMSDFLFLEDHEYI